MESDGRLRESLWQSEWPSVDEDEEDDETPDEIANAAVSQNPPCSPLSATPKVHFCHCGKAYTLKSMRDRHVKMQHLNLRPFSCPVCAKSFKMKHHLTKHVKTHGGLRPYECALCGKKIVWRDSFLKHQARCQQTAAAASFQQELADAAGPVKVEHDDFSLLEEETLS